MKYVGRRHRCNHNCGLHPMPTPGMRWAQVIKAARYRPEFVGEVNAEGTVRFYRERIRKEAKRGEPVAAWLDVIASRLEVEL